MLGLRTDIDTGGVKPLLRPSSSHRSFTFSERLSGKNLNHYSYLRFLFVFTHSLLFNLGRFFVDTTMEGTSHKLKLTETSKQKDEYKKLKRIENELKRQEKKEKEIQQEFVRLKELEDKLAEVRKRKELQKQREEQRNRRKKEFLAAVIISRSWKRYKQKKMITNNRNIIYNFLKAKQTKQIVAIAAWASKTIRRFAKRVTQNFLKRKYLLMLETSSTQASDIVYADMACSYLDSIIEDEVSNKVMDILFIEAEQAYKKMMSVDVVSYGVSTSLPTSPMKEKQWRWPRIHSL